MKIVKIFDFLRKKETVTIESGNAPEKVVAADTNHEVGRAAEDKELQKLTVVEVKRVVGEGIASYFALRARYEAEERQRKRIRSWKRLSVFFVLAFLFGFFVLGGGGNDRVPISEKNPLRPVPGVVGGSGSGKVVVIKLEGGIDGDYLGDASPENTVRYLQDALELAGGQGDSLAGIVLYINSPGGSSAASAQLYRTLKKFRTKHKGVPVIAYVSHGAYSGGYYASLGAERIVVDPEANVANIGVIMRLFNTARIGNAFGVIENEVSTGPRKNAGSQWRELSPEDREMMQRSVDSSFEIFLKAVSESRQIPIDVLRREAKEAQGRTSGAWFSPEDALKGKLIDEIIPVEDFFGIYGPKFAGAKKFKEIEYIQLEKKVGVAELVTKKTEQIFRGALRGIMEESLRQEKQIRAE